MLNNQLTKLNEFNKGRKYLFKENKAKLKLNKQFKMAKCNKSNITFIKTILN